MLKIETKDYTLELFDDPTYTPRSADNVNRFALEYPLENIGKYHVVSRHGIRIKRYAEEVSSCILLAGGGATGVHEHSAILRGMSVFVAVGPYICSLSIPSLEMIWNRTVDWATCFGVYYSEKHCCLLSHGELEIGRYTLDGQQVWKSGGADIFTNGFFLKTDIVEVIDFEERTYCFDIQTGNSIERL